MAYWHRTLGNTKVQKKISRLRQDPPPPYVWSRVPVPPPPLDSGDSKRGIGPVRTSPTRKFWGPESYNWSQGIDSGLFR